MGKVKLLLLIVLAAFFVASTTFAAEKMFKAKLTPKEEVKQPESKATGKATFRLDKDQKKLRYKVYVKNILDATAAHIHVGKKGEDGPPIVGLFSGGKKGNFSGTLAEGSVTADDLMGEYKGNFGELVKLMKAGETYVNVHTDVNPDGEIRGQIK